MSNSEEEKITDNKTSSTIEEKLDETSNVEKLIGDTNKESGNQKLNTEDNTKESTEDNTEENAEDNTKENTEDNTEESAEENIEENTEATSILSNDSDTDIMNNQQINTISEKLISSESESEKESEKEDFEHNNQNSNIKSPSDINNTPKINKLRINDIRGDIRENSISIILQNEDVENSDLSVIEKQIIKKIFVKSIESVREVIDNPSIDSVIAITIIITNIAQLVEHIKINSTSHTGKLPGSMKKNIVLFIGKLIIQKIEFNEQENVLALYDVYADTVLERIIKFAKNNKVSKLVEQKLDESVSQLKNNSKACCIIS